MKANQDILLTHMRKKIWSNKKKKTKTIHEKKRNM